MRGDLKLSQQVLILIGVPLVFEIVFAVILGWMCLQAQEEVKRTAWAHQVEMAKGRLTKCTVDINAGLLNYLWSKNPDWLDLSRKGIDSIPEQFHGLQDLALADQSPTDRKRAEGAMKEYVARLRSTIDFLEKREDPGPGHGLATRAASKRFFSFVNSLTASAKKFEDSSPKLLGESRQRLLNALIAGFVLNVVLAVGLAVYFSRSTARRFARLMETIRQLKNDRELNTPTQGRDEIAEIDRVLREMAASVKEAARKEQAIVENSADVICAITDSGTFHSVSPAATRVWGRSPETLIGAPLEQVIAVDDLEATKSDLAAIRESLKPGEFETRVARTDGSIAHMLWSANWSKEEKLLSCVAHDVSDRRLAEELLKASEARVRSMIENMPVGLLLVDENGSMRMINPTVEGWFGPPSQLEGRHVAELLRGSAAATQDNSQFFSELLEQAMMRTTEHESVGKDGRPFPIELSVRELSINQRLHHLLIMRDVSEQHELKRLKQGFVEMLTEDLRAPLAAVQSFLTRLSVDAHESLSERGLQKAQVARRSTDRMILLINDLVDMEKLESGTFDLNCLSLDLASVIERSVESVRAVAEKRQVRIDAQDSRLNVVADPDRLVQVLVNLLGNAIKFSPEGSTIVVATRQTPEAIEVSVKDEGRGVPETHRLAIFERFRQVDVSDSRDRKGTGLGLAICKALIDGHGGQIGVNSEEGKGSVFWFRIPVAPSAGIGSDGGH